MQRGASLLLIALTLAGCLESSVIRCEDGTICPTDQTCDGHGGCISQQQLQACADHAEGEDCLFEGAAGACRGGLCEVFFCGDGARNGAEPCEGDDFGDTDCTDYGFSMPAGLVCRDNCTIDVAACLGFCGDGIRDGIEPCDGTDVGTADCQDFGFYDAPGLACNAACNYDSTACTGFCGDGIANGPEICDGEPPLGTCTDLGWDMGGPRCGLGCAPALTTCGLLGWRSAVVPGGAVSHVWGFGKRDVVASTNNGIVRWQGGSWNLMPGSPAGVFASEIDFALGGVSDDLYAANDHTLHRWDGATWTQVATWSPSGTAARAVWRAGPNDVWIGDSKLRHWDGTTLTTQSLPVNTEIRSIWGFAPDDIWLGGAQLLRHYDGTSWTQVGFAIDSLTQVWGLAPDDVWAVGYAPGSMYHYDGATWTPVTDLFIGGNAVIWGFAPDDIMVFDANRRFHWNGLAWHEGTSAGLSAWQVWGAAGEVFVSGNGLHIGGASEWTFPTTPTGLYTIESVWMNDDEDGWAAGNSGLEHWDGTAWSPVTLPDGNRPRTLWASGRDDVWGAGYQFVEHWDGDSWTQVLGIDPTLYATAIWGTGTGEVWVTDENELRHWNGTSWSVVPEPVSTAASFSKVFGSGPNDVWAIDTFHVVSHWNGTSLTVRTVPAGSWRAGWAAAPNDVWLVGDVGRTIHWNGVSWTEPAPHTSQGLGSIWGLGPDDIYASGGTTLVHYDGVDWTPVEVPSNVESLWSVHGGTHRLAFSGSVPVSHDGAVFFLERHARWWDP